MVLEHGKIRMEFVVTSAESTGELHQMRVTYAPHSDPPPSHIHPAQDETFETLDGLRSEQAAPSVVPRRRATSTGWWPSSPSTTTCSAWPTTRPDPEPLVHLVGVHAVQEVIDLVAGPEDVHRHP